MISLPNLSAPQTGELLTENLILLGYRGSIAHNMYIPSSDPNSIDDKDELLAIKRGEWPLDQVKQEAERLFELTEAAYLKSTLPPEPDIRSAEALCTSIISDYYGW